MRVEESLILAPCISGFSSSSILETALGFTSLLRVFSSFSELGSEDDEEEEEEEEEAEERDEWCISLPSRPSPRAIPRAWEEEESLLRSPAPLPLLMPLLLLLWLRRECCCDGAFCGCMPWLQWPAERELEGGALE